MSGLPTLLRKGFVVPPKSMSEVDKRRLQNTISIDYILQFISQRIPARRGNKPSIQPKKYGDKVLILKSETGSGKSTTLPAKLYTTFFDSTRKSIAVTQPRILTAMDIPSTIVPYVPELELDKNIGYNTGSFKRLPVERGIIFSTVGVLTQQLIMNTDEAFMRMYQFIVVDEVHERDIETDLCLFLLKKLLESNYDNPECPMVILTSATFNEEIFINYFDVPPQNYIQVIGSTFAIEPHFPEYSIANYIQFATLKSQKIHLDNLDDIHNNDNFRDVIIFVKDTNVGKKIYDGLHLFNSVVLDKSLERVTAYSQEIDTELKKFYKKGGSKEKAYDHYYILPILLDSASFQSGGLEYQNLFSQIDSINVPLWLPNDKGFINTEELPNKYVIPTRRIIIATNIAETGVTIPTLKYCIDTGYYFNVEFNPETGCNVNYAKNVTRGMAVQRRGRVGRKAPGVWYPCFTKETFDAMPEEQFSKIIINDTTENLLSILIKEKNTTIKEELSIKKIKNHKAEKAFQMFKLTDNTWYRLSNAFNTNIASLDFIEMPSMQALSFSIEKLHILGFIDDNYNITTPGFYANKIRFISLEARKMIMSGYCYGANVLDLITIASFIYISKRRIFGKTFKMMNFLKQSDAEFEFYNKILIADEFVNCVFVWNILQAFIQKSLSQLNSDILEQINNTTTTEYKKILYTEDLNKWCEEHDLIYDGIIKVIAIRDQIIQNMIETGLNPYKNSLNIPKNAYNLNKIMLSLPDGLDEIRKLKQCIHEGYKCNILVNRKTNYMVLMRNLPVKVKSQLVSELGDDAEQKKPMYIAVDAYALSPKFGSAQFEFVAEGFVSVLDNFINVDENFFLY